MAIQILRDLRGLRVHVVHPPDTERTKLVEHLRRIAGLGGTSEIYAGDVTRQGDIDAAITLALQRFGRIDALVCAAQSPEARWGTLAEISDAAIDETHPAWALGPFSRPERILDERSEVTFTCPVSGESIAWAAIVRW